MDIASVVKLAPRLAEGDWTETWDLARASIASLPELELRGTPPSPGDPDATRSADGTWSFAAGPEVAIVGAASLGDALHGEALDDQTRKILGQLPASARMVVTLFARATAHTRRQVQALVARAFDGEVPRPMWSDGRFAKSVRFVLPARGPTSVARFETGAWHPIAGGLQPTAAADLPFEVETLGMWAFLDAAP